MRDILHKEVQQCPGELLPLEAHHFNSTACRTRRTACASSQSTHAPRRHTEGPAQPSWSFTFQLSLSSNRCNDPPSRHTGWYPRVYTQ